jgi:hypothetical protein
MTSHYVSGNGEDPSGIEPLAWPPFGTEALPFGAEMLPFGMRMMPTETAMIARWRAAEGRLYPLIMVDPDLYESAVTLVAEATQLLRAECDTLEDLLDVDVAGILARCGTAADAAAAGVSSATAVDAACARRMFELVGSPCSGTEAFSDTHADFLAEGGR